MTLSKDHIVTRGQSEESRKRLVKTYEELFWLAYFLGRKRGVVFATIFAGWMLEDMRTGYIFPRSLDGKILPINNDDVMPEINLSAGTVPIQGRRSPLNMSAHDYSTILAETRDFAREVAGWGKK